MCRAAEFLCKTALAVMLSGLLLGKVCAQVLVYEDYVPEKQRLFMRERFVYVQLHTGGFTLGYEQGRLNRKFNYSGWNVEFATQFNPKAKRVNWYGTGRSYRYGMLNSFYILRGGYGGLWELNGKPQGGGVQVGLQYRGGFSLGFAFPQYIYVDYTIDNAQAADIRLEKMSADNPYHKDVQRVLEGGPLFKGFTDMRPYPGIYAKVGLNFEFGKREERSHTLGFGVMYDCYFTPIPLMMEQKNPIGFLNFYLEYKFGWRYGIR